MAKQPQPQPLQDNTAATIKALTDKINRLESGSSSNKRGGGGSSGQGSGKRQKGWLLPNRRIASGTQDGGIMITTVGHADLISNTTA
jgi:hypothetical protein